TRITEFKHLTGQVHRSTSIVYEFPSSEGDPYYPVPTPENGAQYKRYAEVAAATPNVHFVGRLGTYRYYNMDQVVAQALTLVKQLAAAPEFVPVTAASAAAAVAGMPLPAVSY
ncbi:MAG: UDP-galactopyranose mutase, partial [Acidobacteriaceae bacterium]|nr:UDP-galactopyranose mutase [Acidobacteriaceae bacterium]